MDNALETERFFPIRLEVEEGKTYHWCGCGQSQNPPLCDKKPYCDKALAFEARLTEDVYLCHCKETKNPPWCDGSHGRLLREAIKTKS
jgi:CDGSH iron-sulfur domain-containing protein 3